MAYRAALEEMTRERVPLDWAATQANLGTALSMLGERESGTARLEEAVVAYRAALKERTREHVPLQWAMTLGNEGVTLRMIAERKQDLALAERHSSKSKRHEVLSKRPDMLLTQPITPSRLSSRELWSIHCEKGNEGLWTPERDCFINHNLCNTTLPFSVQGLVCCISPLHNAA